MFGANTLDITIKIAVVKPLVPGREQAAKYKSQTTGLKLELGSHVIMAVDVLTPHGSKFLPDQTVSSIKVRESLFSTLSQAITDKKQSIQIATGNALVSEVAELGRAVRVRRRSLSISQTELAKAARVGRRFVSDFENGKETVALREALSVCSAAGLRIFLSSRD